MTSFQNSITYRSIPLSAYPRQAHFAYFCSLSYPYVGVTVEVDLTSFLAACKENSWPFFLSFLYAVSNAANSIPALRQRITWENGQAGIIEYSLCPTSHTVALPDGTYCYCELRADLPFSDYLPYAKEQQTRAMEAASMEDGADGRSLFFVSSLPWLNYTALVQPVPIPADSNPRLTFGKYHTEPDGRTMIPVSILCHHALTDGLHLGQFYAALDQALAAFPAVLPLNPASL